MLDGSAQRTAKLILPIDSSRTVEIIPCIEIGVAQEFEGVSMK